MGRAFTVQLLKIICLVYLGKCEVMQLRVTPRCCVCPARPSYSSQKQLRSVFHDAVPYAQLCAPTSYFYIQ